MTSDIKNINYPCLVIDVGSSKIPKHFDKEDVRETIHNINFFECACYYLENANHDDFQPENFNYFKMDNTPLSMKGFIDYIDPLLEECTIIAHNVDTDLKLISGMYHLSEREMQSSNIKKFCTMLYGRKYSKTHIYRGGKKVKKYPHLQELLNNLLNGDFKKGSIIDDVYQCFVCFKVMESMENEINLKPPKH